MKVSIIVGNGFNFLIESIINQTDNLFLPANLSTDRNSLANKIREISTLWQRFNTLFENLKESIPNHSDEELIRMIYAVLDFFSSLDSFEKVLPREDLDRIKSSFDFLLIEQIRSIAEEFRIHQSSEGYKDLKRIFPDFGDSFKDLLDTNSISSCDIFTTNYDGILDTLLTKSEGRGFLSVDGFGRIPDDPNYLKIYEDNLYNHKIRLLHIHGSYRFEKRYGTTYKTRGNTVNRDPVIIFNNPDQKEELVARDPVLNEYFRIMSTSLEHSDRLIIFGNSMINEPHIKRKIRKHFNREEQQLFVCSRRPEEISKQIKRYYQHTIIEKSTQPIATIDSLLKFFEEIFKYERNEATGIAAVAR